MNHFEEEAWFDFVRRLLSRERHAAMQRHLDEGCARCSRIYKTWKTVLEIAAREIKYEPPDSSTRVVKAAFNLYNRGSLLPQGASMAHQIYDSFVEPLPAGVRSGSPAARRLLYAEGDRLIDLRLDVRDSGRIALTGQALDKRGRPEYFAHAAVGLMRGDEMVACTTANAFGEFQINFKIQDELKLFIEIGGDAAIGVSLGLT